MVIGHNLSKEGILFWLSRMTIVPNNCMPNGPLRSLSNFDMYDFTDTSGYRRCHAWEVPAIRCSAHRPELSSVAVPGREHPVRTVWPVPPRISPIWSMTAEEHEVSTTFESFHVAIWNVSTRCPSPPSD